MMATNFSYPMGLGVHLSPGPMAVPCVVSTSGTRKGAFVYPGALDYTSRMSSTAPLVVS